MYFTPNATIDLPFNGGRVICNFTVHGPLNADKDFGVAWAQIADDVARKTLELKSRLAKAEAVRPGIQPASTRYLDEAKCLGHDITLVVSVIHTGAYSDDSIRLACAMSYQGVIANTSRAIADLADTVAGVEERKRVSKMDVSPDEVVKLLLQDVFSGYQPAPVLVTV